MRKYILLAIVMILTACGGNALSSKTTADSSASAIPTGVQVLKKGSTYDVNKAPGHLVVIDFNATWCGPCLRFAPIFEETAEEFAGSVEFISIDIDQHQNMAQELGITSIPTILFIQPDGKLNMWVGFLPKAELVKAINQLK